MALYNSSGNEKNPGDRARRNAETYVIDHVEWDGQTRGPDLPEGVTWCPQTLHWWEKWRNSPQSMIMTDLDWEFMVDTARLYDMYWGASGRSFTANSMTQLAGEIRQRLGKFGVSYEDRKKLRMTVETPMTTKTEDDEVQEIVNYAEKLTRAASKKKPKPLTPEEIRAEQEKFAQKEGNNV